MLFINSNFDLLDRDTIKLKAFIIVVSLKATQKGKMALMSSKPLIGYIDIRVFAHATEDPEKVHTAVYNLLPQELVETFVFE